MHGRLRFAKLSCCDAKMPLHIGFDLTKCDPRSIAIVHRFQTSRLTHEGNTDSNLRLTSSLPAGWAVTGSSLPCATVSLGNTCVLTLTYTPTVATPSSSLLLGYAYTDNAGQPRTGSQVITYSADSHLAFITNADSNTVTHCAVGVAGQLVNCSAQTSPNSLDLSQLSLTAEPSM